ncbi:DUF748 domain-containing protein [Paucibacter sp. Y2R2-4]|uniref:DUF748 domain-containing protein n=1 Tax=Paucibacter sp. Y2R2-4 TaxID=2893553 RepID=UPI0021E35BE5|nr:DUF748 domain-containing protein [Paucibacter sp. Y2R2-4]MCV2348470.1 DUF748 domain-containing protein [Paucibacter sp. Y2R2-4]
MAAVSKPTERVTGLGWKRWTMVGIAGLAMLALALCLGLPWWVKSSGAHLASQALGRQVTIDEFSVAPWRLGVALEGLRISGADGKSEPLLEVQSIDAALSLRSLWFASPVVEHLSITRPVLRLSHLSAGHYDIDDLLARFASPKTPGEAESPPPKLAVYNISLREGQVLLDDQPAHRQHQLSELALDLPFVSTLDADVKVHVQPQASGRLNGVYFGGKGQALPFAEHREAKLDFKLEGFDLAPYIDYLPRDLPLRLKQGRVDAALALKFQQPRGQAPNVGLSGSLDLAKFALQTPGGDPWLSWRDLHIELRDVQPLRRQLDFGSIQWKSPEVALSRDARGQLCLPGASVKAESNPAKAEVPEARVSKAQAPATPWRVSSAGLEVTDGRVSWRDASLASPVVLSVFDLRTQVGAVAWPLKAEVPIEWGMSISPEAAAAQTAAKLSGQGRLSPDALNMDWRVSALDLHSFEPYARPFLQARVKGRLDVAGQIQLKAPLLVDPVQRLALGLRELELRGLSLSALTGPETLLSLGALGLDQLDVDLGAQQLVAGQLKLSRPVVALKRDLQGVWNFQALSAHKTILAQKEDQSKPTLPPSSKAADRPWSLQLKKLNLEQGLVQVTDAATRGSPAAFKIEQLGLSVADLAWPASRGAIPVNLSFKLGALTSGGKTRSNTDSKALGSLQWQGQASLEPMSASGRLRLDRLPLHLAEGYLDPALGLHLQKLELGLRSDFNVSLLPAGLQARASGDALLADLKLQQSRRIDGQQVVGEDLLDWQAMKLNGFKLELQPGQVPQLSVGEASLSDFYARVIINEAGQINLRELGAGDAAREARPSKASMQPNQNSGIPLAPDAKEVALNGAASQAAASPAPMAVSVGQVLLEKGRVDFSDRFVRPNYSARLTELRGSLGAVSSTKTDMAPLTLRGRVAGTGLLDITGQLNPLGKPLALDLTASATDIELAPLSPYAAKYVGYGLERGKFSSKLQYKIDPDGRLSANNQIILNQLTFGDKVDSPDATKLPVLFAVSLLKDKDGVIDIELPVSGSLNDPQFSLGGLIWKVIVNLFSKAITSPFSLFAGSGGADLSRMEFVPGTAQASAPADLDKVAKMLNERPGLALTITAWADPLGEREAMKQRQLDEALFAERKRELQRQRTGASFATAQEEIKDLGPLSDAEKARLLKVVYESSKLPTKPRNFLGMAKDIPAAEMRRLLLDSFEVSEERVRQLALERGVVLRDALIAKGLPNGRLFLGAPRLLPPQVLPAKEAAASAPAQEAPPAQAWAPYAELKLSSH